MEKDCIDLKKCKLNFSSSSACLHLKIDTNLIQTGLVFDLLDRGEGGGGGSGSLSYLTPRI